MIVIRQALDPNSIESIRALFTEYQESLGVDLSFQNFENELLTLPGDYAPPGGTLLIAEDNRAAAGCAALRPLFGGNCEMKRLYVRPQYRSSGVGRQLAERLIEEALGLNYERIYLDTLPMMTGAQKLYERLGFQDVQAYRPNPIAGSRFMCLTLNTNAPRRNS